MNPGDFPESDVAVSLSGLAADVRRLRRAGLSDLAVRAYRYPTLARMFTRQGHTERNSVLARIAADDRLFRTALELLPGEQLRQAAMVLFHVGAGGAPPPLDRRRRLADRIYTGNTHSREPDTIQRYLERDVLDPLLVEALITVHRRSATGGAAPSADDQGPNGADIDEIGDMNRRQFMRSVGATSMLAVAPADDAIASSTSSESLSQTDVDDFAFTNAELWRAFANSHQTSEASSKQQVFRLVGEHLDVLKHRLQLPVGVEKRRRLCRLTADLLQLSGEIFFDSLHYVEAAHCYTMAAGAAKEADAFDLWACAATRLAYVNIYERDLQQALQVLELAERLSRRGDPQLSTRYWVHAVKAQALAGAGQQREFQRAAHLSAEVNGLPGRCHNNGWLRFDGSRIAEERGGCLVKLHRPDLAEPDLLQALGSPSSHRRRANVLANLAVVGAQNRDREQLVHFARQALEVAHQTRSGVVAREVAQLRPYLDQYAGTHHVEDLNRQIMALPHLPTIARGLT